MTHRDFCRTILSLLACLALLLGGGGVALASALAPGEEVETSQGEERSERGECPQTDLLTSTARERALEAPEAGCERPPERPGHDLQPSPRAARGAPVDTWQRPRRC
ncbi:MAG: hypothetical protein KDD82_24760 [Planctomycetes bacterium]|nr:hypothetical protein [Planctomycetota bacterium]